MLVLPALLLRDGACVAPGSGAYLLKRAPLDEPVACARLWADCGFSRLHVVDLDAVAGRGANDATIAELLRDDAIEMEIGGGLRSMDAIERTLDAGAVRVVVGTRALEEMDWLRRAAATFPGEIIVAADVRQRRIVTRGWSRTLHLDILDAVEDLNAFPLAALLVTAVHREAQHEGADLRLMEDVADASELPVMAAGGILDFQDLRQLDDGGIDAAIVGAGLWSGNLDPRTVADQFSG
jgi:phosphoribosylformimino-5-aminoimidazole carboxamide ribotide isomerase